MQLAPPTDRPLRNASGIELPRVHSYSVPAATASPAPMGLIASTGAGESLHGMRICTKTGNLMFKNNDNSRKSHLARENVVQRNYEYRDLIDALTKQVKGSTRHWACAWIVAMTHANLISLGECRTRPGNTRKRSEDFSPPERVHLPILQILSAKKVGGEAAICDCYPWELLAMPLKQLRRR